MTEKIDEQTEILKDILKWIKFSGMKEVRNILMGILDNEQKRLIYHLSDGNNGSIDIARAANVGATTVRRYWESWSRTGIVESLSIQGGLRYKKIFELEDFGFNVPQSIVDNHNNEEVI